jgi:dTDP-4-dehydrorhamnose reductase
MPKFMPKKIVILGANGQLGKALTQHTSSLDSVSSFTRNTFDICNSKHYQILHDIKPDIIINAAAYTAVDLAETEEDSCYEANTIAAACLAKIAKQLQSIFIHFSTDYVFDGEKNTEYTETDPACPLNVYGQSKWEGEQAIQSIAANHLIFRVSWLYSHVGKNFFNTCLRLGQTQQQLRMIADQWGAPTYTNDIARAIIKIIQLPKDHLLQHQGLYHMSAQGKTHWQNFATHILTQAQSLQPEQPWKIENIDSIKTADYPTAAKRPKNSLLSNQKLQENFNITLPTWEQGLQSCLKSWQKTLQPQTA